jgi:Amidohydrolase family
MQCWKAEAAGPLGSGAAARIGGAASIQGDAGPSGEPMSVSGDVAAHDPLSTRLTREYGVRFPFVSAGMGFVSYPPLVTAVSNAGDIGVLGNAIEPAPSTRIRLAIGSDAVGTVRGPLVDLLFAQINPSNQAAAISLEAAITAYTKGSAYAEFKENVKGSLTPLSAADLVVVDRDIFNLERLEDILATQVLLTMVNGNVVHEIPRALTRKQATK